MLVPLCDIGAVRSLVVLLVGVLAAGCTSDAPTEPDRPGASGALGPAASASASAPSDLALRAAHTMTELPGGRLLVAGGCVVDGCSTATTSTYVVDGVRAEPTGSLGEPRDAHSATALTDGPVLVAGGFPAEGQAPLARAEVYDPETGRWARAGRLQTARGGHAAALLGDGRVLVAGGWTGPGTVTASTEIFDPATGRFTAGPALPEAVLGPAATSLADGSVLLTGGESRPGTGTRLAVRVFPDGSLRRVGPMLTGRFKHAVVTLPGGQAMVIGGTTDDRTLLAGTEIFDPATDRFRPGPQLRDGRYKLSGAAVLPDGRVVVAGGGPGVEVIDPRTGRSRFLPAAGRGRASFSTVGLSDGVLRVIGGYDEAIRLTGTDLAIPLGRL
jgi:hypothetical protein